MLTTLQAAAIQHILSGGSPLCFDAPEEELLVTGRGNFIQAGRKIGEPPE